MKKFKLSIITSIVAIAMVGCGGGGGGGSSSPKKVTIPNTPSPILGNKPSNVGEEEEEEVLIPVEEDPIIEEPVIEEPVVEEDPIIEDPIEEESPIEEPIVEEPIIEDPIEEEPVVEDPIEVPVIEEPVIEEPVIEDPVVEEDPIVEEPVVEEPVIEDPIVEEPVIEEPIVEEPIIEDPVVEEPVVEDPVIEEPVVEEPIEEDPIVEEPVVAPTPPELGFDINDNYNADYLTDFTLGTQSTVDYFDIQSTEYTTAQHLTQVGAHKAYEQGWTGEGVTVAVLDSGIDDTHNDLNGKVIGSADLLTPGVTAHGTHVAGIIAGKKNGEGVHGVAYGADLLDVQVTGDGGGVQAIVDGLDYSVNNNAKIANMSIGLYYWSELSNDMYANDFRNALDNDLSLIISAGNKAGDCKDLSSDQKCNVLAALPAYDANKDFTNNTLDGAFVAVGAVDWDNNITSYSNKAGITKDWFIVAPGGDIYNGGGVKSTQAGTTDGVQELAGTSQAAPIVSGAFALMSQKFPYLKGREIRDIYFSTATDLGDPGVDEVYGHGLINIEKAMRPIGELNIAQIQDNGPKFALNKTQVSAGGAFGESLKLASLANTLTVDDYGRGYRVDLSAAVSNSGENVEQFSMDQFRELKFKNGLVLGFNDIDDHFAVGMDFDIAKVMYTRKNDLFGTEGTGALSIKGKTDYVEVSFKEYNGLSANVLYGRGTAQVGGLLTDISTVSGLGYGLRYKDESEKLNIGFSIPMRVMSGTLKAKIPEVKTQSGEIKYRTSSNELRPDGQEIRFFASKIFEISENEEFLLAGGYTKDRNNIRGNDYERLVAQYRWVF